MVQVQTIYSHKHHWTYVHGSPPIHVSDEIRVSRNATPDDLQNVALRARTLISEQYAHESKLLPLCLRARILQGPNGVGRPSPEAR